MIPYPSVLYPVTAILLLSFFMTGCATRHGYQGAGAGALTGATAGILLDPDNRWRGAVIGGSLGSIFGGALTDTPRQNNFYYDPAYYHSPPAYPQSYYQPGVHRQHYYNQGYYQQNYYQPRTYTPSPPQYSTPNRAGRGAVIGGVTGAAAGALLDDGNAWRGSLIGGALGSLFGGSIGAINSSPRIPVLSP
ncbi:MAG: glycine zipper 2TM domain-containing protein [Thermodesulfobacteriota bacterium]|nr:glycine zipper 2TM domain-containing protein [Thermodesulfobacteriota bacterium]